MNIKKLQEIVIEGIDTKDYPDFADAYIQYAEHSDGTPLTDAELDELNDKHGDFVHEQAHKQFF